MSQPEIPGFTASQHAALRLHLLHFHAYSMSVLCADMARTLGIPLDIKLQVSLWEPKLAGLLERLTPKNYREGSETGQSIMDLHGLLNNVVTRALVDVNYINALQHDWAMESLRIQQMEQIAYDALELGHEGPEKTRASALEVILNRLKDYLGHQSVDGLRKEIQHRVIVMPQPLEVAANG